MGSNPLQNFYGFCYSPRTLSSNSSIVQTKWHLRTWEGSALKSVTDLRVPAKRQPSPIQLLAFSTTQSSVCVQAPVQTVFPLDSTGEQCTLLYANHHTERCSSPCWPVSSSQYFRVRLLCFMMVSLGEGGGGGKTSLDPDKAPKA